jgi:hypothetical protein
VGASMQDVWHNTDTMEGRSCNHTEVLGHPVDQARSQVTKQRVNVASSHGFKAAGCLAVFHQTLLWTTSNQLQLSLAAANRKGVSGTVEASLICEFESHLCH